MLSEREEGPFPEFFRQPGRPGRDKFLSRLFGIFSEEVVRAWCTLPSSPYEDIGRPYLKYAHESRGHTLDFTLRDRITGELYVAEMKCELEFERYRYLLLTGPEQVKHHEQGAAFKKFMGLSRNPGELQVSVRGRQVEVAGTVLVWGAATAQGADAVREHYGLHDLLTVDGMLPDLRSDPPEGWSRLMDEFRSWSAELFDFLAFGNAPQP